MSTTDIRSWYISYRNFLWNDSCKYKKEIDFVAVLPEAAEASNKKEENDNYGLSCVVAGETDMHRK